MRRWIAWTPGCFLSLRRVDSEHVWYVVNLSGASLHMSVKAARVGACATIVFGRYFADTRRAMPNAAAAANPPITAVRKALGSSGMPV